MATQEIGIEMQARSVDWGAVLAGAAGAAAISVLLVGFGTALGLSMTSAYRFAGVSGSTFAIIAGLWFALVHIASFYTGGYVTGRMRRAISVTPEERHFRDGVHGFLVWAVGTLAGAYFLASTASAITSKIADTAGQAVQAVGAAGQVAGQAASQAAASPENRASAENALSYYADRLFRRTAAGAQGANAPANPPQDRAAAVAEASRILAMAVYNDRLEQNDRTYLASVVAAQAGVPQEDAARRVDEVFNAAQTAKNETIAKARDAADGARRTGVLAAFLAAAVSLAGLVAAAGGGGRGWNEPRREQGAVGDGLDPVLVRATRQASRRRGHPGRADVIVRRSS